jgi:hypothetical protein
MDMGPRCWLWINEVRSPLVSACVWAEMVPSGRAFERCAELLSVGAFSCIFLDAGGEPDLTKRVAMALNGLSEYRPPFVPDAELRGMHLSWSNGLAWNGAGGSSIVTGTSFTAATKTAASSLPTSVTPHAPSSTYPAAAHYYGGTTQEYSSIITFTPSASKDVERYEFGINVNAGQDPTLSGGFTFATVPSGATQVQYNTILLIPQYLWYRAKNVSGIWTAWTDSGYNMNSYVAIPSGTMSSQNSTAVAITGGTSATSSERTASLIVAPAAASNPRAMTALFAGSGTFSFVGTAPTETLDVDITDRGFTAKPDWGLIQLYDTNFLGVYDYDTGSSATNARFGIFSRDGGNLGAGGRRFHFIVGKY